MKSLFRSASTISYSCLSSLFLVATVLWVSAKAGTVQAQSPLWFSEELPTPAGLPHRTALPPAVPATLLNEPDTVIARVIPIAGKVNVRVRNNVGTQIVFEAAGYTFPNALSGGQSITIHDLPTPVTVKISRADGGLMKVHPLQTLQPGILDVEIDEASPLSDDSGTMRIQSNGQVVLDQ